MTNYQLKELAERICEHSRTRTVCTCPRKPLSDAVKLYLKTKAAKRVYGPSITYNPEWTPDYAKYDRFRCLERATGDWKSPGLRFVGKVHEIRMSGSGNLPYIDRGVIDHNGWYTDPHHDVFKDGTGLCWGVVYQLPARNGKWQYVPGCQNGDMGDGDSPILDFHSITDDIRQAIRNADSMAESYAESEREYQAKQMAEERIEDIKTKVTDTRNRIRALVHELREVCPALHGKGETIAALRAQLESMRASIRELKQEQHKLEDDYWAVVGGC